VGGRVGGEGKNEATGESKSINVVLDCAVHGIQD